MFSIDRKMKVFPFSIMKGASNCVIESSRRSEEHTSELQSPCNLVCRLLLEKKKIHIQITRTQMLSYSIDSIFNRGKSSGVVHLIRSLIRQLSCCITTSLHESHRLIILYRMT